MSKLYDKEKYVPNYTNIKSTQSITLKTVTMTETIHFM